MDRQLARDARGTGVYRSWSKGCEGYLGWVIRRQYRGESAELSNMTGEPPSAQTVMKSLGCKRYRSWRKGCKGDLGCTCSVQILEQGM